MLRSTAEAPVKGLQAGVRTDSGGMRNPKPKDSSYSVEEKKEDNRPHNLLPPHSSLKFQKNTGGDAHHPVHTSAYDISIRGEGPYGAQGIIDAFSGPPALTWSSCSAPQRGPIPGRVVPTTHIVAQPSF
ncbi:hypothetical protein E5288_WYG012859 [Bos mutus]|uniref:Uncharacterized protein n=1 Tax=Bos mutus TaxID=72004 RepID=A0A6B0QXG2_9CETA|nr:hypothetical protein [Bos mutus]